MHRHRVATTSKPLPFVGPVAERLAERLAGQTPMAWGGVGFHQRCACGATREILVNRDHDEIGPWVPTPATAPWPW